MTINVWDNSIYNRVTLLDFSNLIVYLKETDYRIILY
jgi:hypothetical protein